MISAVLVLMGLITLLFAASQGGNVKAFSEMGLSSFAAVSTGILYLGIVIVLTGCLGCLTAKFKNPCFAIPFGILAFIFGLVLLIMGFAIFAATSPKVLNLAKDRLCRPGNAFEGLYSATIDKTLCSKFCPCDESLKESWPLINDDAKLRTFGRTLAFKGSERNAYISKGNEAAIVELEFAAAGSDPAPVKNFKECYTTQLKDMEGDAKTKKTKEFIETGGFQGLEYIETNYDCAAFCKAPLFFITTDYNVQPQKSCLDSFVEEVGGSSFRGVAIVSILTAIISICGCCGSFPLCTKFNDEEDAEK